VKRPSIQLVFVFYTCNPIFRQKKGKKSVVNSSSAL